jgi:dynein heavy chain
MLSIVVKHEEPQRYEKRNQCIIQRAENEKKVAELQDKILNQIATSQGDILDDDELVVTLDASKAQCQQIDTQLKEMQQTMNAIELIRD